MSKKIFSIIISLLFLLNAGTAFAQTRPNSPCGGPTVGTDCCNADSGPCIVDGSYQCLPWLSDNPRFKKGDMVCQEAPVGKVFGKIKIPDTLGGLIKNNPTGAGAISQFLTNFIILLYSIAAIVLVFMLVWAAFEWLTSGGDKEKIAAAQKRILHAIIGIILFAVAFAIIRILGVFTGFTFFKEPNYIVLEKDSTGKIIQIRCKDNGYTITYPTDPEADCRAKSKP